MPAYRPKTGAKCLCRPGIARDNCPTCEGTGWVIDFKAIHAQRAAEDAAVIRAGMQPEDVFFDGKDD